MDEVVFRTSQKVDNIQYHLKIAADEGKNAVAHFSEKIRGVTLRILENPRYAHVIELIRKLAAIAFKTYQECKKYIIVHYHPKILLRKVFKLLGKNFTKREILIGSAGLLVGAIIGFCISNALPRSRQVLRYMQAIQCLKYGGEEAVVLVEDALGPKECRKNEVLINVKAASLNTIDIKICKGYGSLLRKIAAKYFQHCPGEFPITLGRDCTGVVVDIGENISHLEIGDEVWLTAAFWAPGTLTEYTVVSENKVSHKPKTIGFEGAASLPYCGSIALSVLNKINVTPKNANKKSVFVHGGCSATGCILVQILTAWGAKVTTSCYKRAIPVAKALGVEDVIGLSPLSSNEVASNNADISLLREELRYREKFDVVVTTTVCELNNQELLEFCKSNGKVISTLPQPLRSDATSYFARALYSVRFRISSYLQKIFTGYLNNFGEEPMCRHILDELRELVEDGKIQTVVDRVFQPHDIEHAINHIQSSESIGSTVISFR